MELHIMKYKDAIQQAMTSISTDQKVVHIGYGVGIGGNAAGSLINVSPEQKIETPVAENLMLGLAIGMSIEGYIPVVYYERFDFIMNAMDALVNHLDKIEQISKKEYSPKVIIRCLVGGKKAPFFTGVTHTQDFTEGLKLLLTNIDVVKLGAIQDIPKVYFDAYHSNKSTIIIEEKDRFGESN